MKKCISCGVELDDDARFCGECGTKQPELKKTCRNCGTEIPSGAKFCMECGTPTSTHVSSNIQSNTVIHNPTTDMSEIMVTQPDKSTISVNVKGVPFNLKLVRGRDYGTDQEIADYFMGETPVTQALWLVVMEDNPSSDNANILYPVTNITPSLATALLVKLQKLTGVKFELPTEVQWKHAYKGGNKSKGYKYAGSNELAETGWADRKLHPVGQLFANELGLTDMEGNVEELLKGGEWAKISIDTEEKLKDNELSGMRLVINVLVDETLESTTPLQAAIASHQAVIIPAREAEILERKRRIEEEARIKAEEEAAARLEAEEKLRQEVEKFKKRISTLKKESKRIRYAKDEANELEKFSPYVMGDEYLKHQKEEQDLLSQVEGLIKMKQLKWEQYGCKSQDVKYPEGVVGYRGDIQYAIHKDILILDGKGRMPRIPPLREQRDSKESFWMLNKEIQSQMESITKVVILGTIYTIGPRCFRGFKRLTTVILPNSIDSIRIEAFYGCGSLKYVNLPKELTEIKEGAFENTGLKSIFIPATVTTCEEKAFRNSDLSLVFIPRLCHVDKSAFDNCENLK